jgi:tetratricopeptide (TPR) repeat protein
MRNPAMRAIVPFVWLCGLLPAQEAPPPAETPAPATVVTVDVAPLRAPDLDSPYASPRDAARHRFQATLAELKASRNTKAALQGFGEALILDRTYAAATFNLGVVAAIAEKWEDALGAFEETARLDPNGLGKTAAPQIERLRLMSSLGSTPDGRRTIRYDEALYPVLMKLSKLKPADAMTALAEVGRIDPKRWEAPALLGGLNGDGRGYNVAVKFLEIAVADATVPAIKLQLQKALHAAERELSYDASRAAADAAADRGEYEKAASLYEATWAIIPARASNGMDAASAWLLHDDTGHAVTLLARLRESGNDDFSVPAVAMLKELEPIEPAAKATGSDAAQFFRDAGSAKPVRVASLIPRIDTSNMEILARPLPALVQDPEPVVLLAALSANPADAAQAAALPILPAPRLAGENPWRELSQLANPTPAGESAAAERPSDTVDLTRGGRVRRLLQVTTQPAGARIFIGDTPEPACQSPCTVQVGPGNYSVRANLPGYEDETRQVRVTTSGTSLQLPLRAIRGNVIVQTSAPAELKLNDTAVSVPAPVELSVVPGLYRISANFGSTTSERLITIKPGARLRIELHP